MAGPPPVTVHAAFESEDSFSCYCHKDFFSSLEPVTRRCGRGAVGVIDVFSPPEEWDSALSTAG